MARPLRIEFPGALYHVTARGNARQDIYLDARDSWRFLDLLGEVCTRYEWRCFGYCLMTTMVHLVPHATDMGLTSVAAAGLLAVIGGVSIGGKMAAGWFVDRIGSRKVFLSGFIFLTLAYLVLIFAVEAWTFYLFAVIFGLAYSGCTVPQAPLATSRKLWRMTSRSDGAMFNWPCSSAGQGSSGAPAAAPMRSIIVGLYKVPPLAIAAISRAICKGVTWTKP